jgi:hypothetical protein
LLGIIDGENFEIESSQIAVGAEADRFAEGQSVNSFFARRCPFKRARRLPGGFALFNQRRSRGSAVYRLV